ncbi:unnamed protein product, partial [marine sediment metagenome]
PKQQIEKEEEGKIALDILREEKIKQIARIIDKGFMRCKTISGGVSQSTLEKWAEKILELST